MTNSRSFLVVLLLLAACFSGNSHGARGLPLGPPQQWEQAPQPGSHTELDRVVERELTRMHRELWTIALRTPDEQAQIQQSMEIVAHQIQQAVQLQISLPDALERVARAVAQLRSSPTGQEMARRVQVAKDTQRRSTLLLASQPSMRAPGQSAEDELQVNLAIASVQMRQVATLDGGVAGLPSYRVAPGNERLQSALDKRRSLPKADLSQLPALFVKAYNGDPDEAVQLLQADFARQENILSAWPWPRGTNDTSAKNDRSFLQFTVDTLLSLAQRNPQHASLTQLAYETLLAYRTRDPEVERRISAALTEAGTEEVKHLRTELRALREQIATIELKRASAVAISAEDEQTLQAARQQEREALARGDKLAQLARNQDRPFKAGPGLARMRADLKPQEAVVSFVEFRQVRPDNMNDPSTWPRWYGAFVTTRERLIFVPLELASGLEPAIETLLGAITSTSAPIAQKQQLAHALYTRSFAPLRDALKDTRELVIVADGMLQLVPIQVLRDDTGWLAERYRFRYVVSERQLAGEYSPTFTPGPPRIVVGGPYSEHPKPLKAGETLSASHFPKLTNLQAEARAVQALLPGAVLISEASATEAVLDGPAPSVLHIAAHGIYLPLGTPKPSDDRGLVLVASAPAKVVEPARPSTYRPPVDDSAALTKSALVLTPARRPHADGFLTAYEIAAQDLWGTDLVVLSACETGRGVVDRVRGVRGLRSAFFIAGASSLVLSLWSIDDRVTVEFMHTFYELLAQRVDRAEALAKASDAVRAKYPDPYLWAPFILLGDAGPLRSAPAAAAGHGT
ncbi:MAG: hypothetical protein RLZZ450_2724 [Pseudomonadota bacterium]|jgi:CHAT domain-containing protein